MSKLKDFHQSEASEVTGTLTHARWDDVHHIVWGYIHDDVRGRFIDGSLIHTSYVVKGRKPEKPEFIETLNSRYKVGWLDDEGDHNR